MVTLVYTAPQLPNYQTAGGVASWNSLSTWQADYGSGFVAALAIPNGTNSNIITIRSGHYVFNTVAPAITADQLVIEAGGTLSLTESTFNLLNGVGNDLVCSGTLISGDMNFNIASGANINILAGGTFDFNTIGNITGAGLINILSGATFTIDHSGDDLTFGGGLAINNYGAITWTTPAGDLYLNDNSILNNYASFTASNQGSMSSLNTGTFTNQVGATFTKEGLNTTFIDAGINWSNYGLVSVDQNTLAINSAAAFHQGNYSIANGATLSSSVAIVFEGDTVINNGTISIPTFTFENNSPQSISGTGVIENLTINSPSNIILSGDQTITNSLTLTAGKIITGSNKIVTDDGGVINGGSATSYISGNLQRNVSAIGNYDFAVGGSAYAPVTLGFDDIATPGFITVSATDGDHPNIAFSGIHANKSVNRYWSITPQDLVINPGGSDIYFNWDNGDRDIPSDFNNYRVANYNGGLWTLPTASGQDNVSISVQNVSSFGEFQIGETAGLPADYRTVINGQWEDPAIWEYYNGSLFVPAQISPDANSSNINIRHQVDLTGSTITLDQVRVENGGILSFINSTVNYYNDNY